MIRSHARLLNKFKYSNRGNKTHPYKLLLKTVTYTRFLAKSIVTMAAFLHEMAIQETLKRAGTDL